MIKEEYVSFEVAKLLKEEGFDEECHHVYDGENIEWTNILYGEDVLSNSEILDFDVISAPTQQMAMRWLRECWKDKEGCIDGFCIEPYAAAYRYGFTISRVPTGSHVCNEDDVYPNEEFESYEEAVEAALKYCLENLI